MKKPLFILIILIITSMLSSCFWVTMPITEKSGTSIPLERIYQPSYFGIAQNKNETTVSFYRDIGFMGGGCAHYLYIGDVKIFEIWQGEKVTIHIPSGNYLFQIKMWGKSLEKLGMKLCKQVTVSKEVTLKSGEHEVYRISLSSKSKGFGFRKIKK